MVGSNCIHYDGDISTKMADISTTKLFFNSILSTSGAWCMIGDLKDFYLGTPMPPKDYAYMCIPIAILPPDTILDHYNLQPLIYKSHVYVEIQWGTYSLPQASNLPMSNSNNFLNHTYTTLSINPRLIGTHHQRHTFYTCC